jgi:hypothetical protein
MNIITILQYALTSIFALEQSLPQSGFGSTKKQIILSGVETLTKATALESATLAQAGSNPGTNTAISQISALAGEFVDKTVAALNASKAFKKA